MELENMTYEKEGNIAILTLNRPDKLNALTTAMWQGLLQAIQTIQGDDDVRALILTGMGRAFSAGSDVSDRLEKRISGVKMEETRKDLLEPVGYLAFVMQSLDKPAIAAINGTAVGAGLSLALLCDIRIASETARFGAAWVKMGLIADVGATYTLPRVVGTDKALEMMATGEMIDAEEAARIGLVTEVVPSDDLMKKVRDLASKIASNPPVAVELMKRAVYKGLRNDLLTQLDFETYAQNVCRHTEDHKEAVKAFLEKRKPSFIGK